MDKSLRIQLIARNNALRGGILKQRRKDREKWKRYQHEVRDLDNIRQGLCKSERLNRRQDWMAGSLAPMRDVGLLKDKYGAIDGRLTQPPDVPRNLKAPARDRLPDFSIVAGDRVVVVSGPDRIRGQIGQVQDVDKVKQTVTIIGVNVLDTATPDTAPRPAAGESVPPFTTVEAPISIKDVRLVRPLSSPENPNVYHDYIVRHITKSKTVIERRQGSNLPNYTRYITGSNSLSSDGSLIEIPWPEERMVEDAPRRTPADTPSLYVEEETYYPSIYAAPLGYVTTAPEDGTALAKYEHKITQGIYDELRNKYSVAATYNVDLVQRKILEDARAIWYRDRTSEGPKSILAREQSISRKEAAKEAINGFKTAMRKASLSKQVGSVEAMKTFVKRSGAVAAAIPLGKRQLDGDIVDAVQKMQQLNLKVKTVRAGEERIEKTESQGKKLAKEPTSNKEFRELKRKGEMIPRRQEGSRQEQRRVTGTMEELKLKLRKDGDGKVVWKQYKSVPASRTKSALIPPSPPPSVQEANI